MSNADILCKTRYFCRISGKPRETRLGYTKYREPSPVSEEQTLELPTQETEVGREDRRERGREGEGEGEGGYFHFSHKSEYTDLFSLLVEFVEDFNAKQSQNYLR